MTSRTIKSAVIIALLAVAGYWYWSPFLAIRQLQSAAQTKDADAFNERVDYPKLRESLKGQLSARMAEEIGQSAESNNPFAALGTALGMALVNQVVETMVRPEVVMQAMQSGMFAPPAKTPAVEQPASPNVSTDTAAAEREKPKWTYERKGVDKLIAYAVDPKAPETPSGQRAGLVFERSGFANWKLTELRLPQAHP